jgi:HlyD family secretion protein
MSASVDILTESKTNVLTVPLQSVTTMADSLLTMDTLEITTKSDQPAEVVFKYNNGKAVVQVVKTGIQDNDYIEILSGLEDGMEVVTAPYNVITKKLKNGSSLKKVSEEDLIEE